ncbi:MAG: 2-hydroxyacyl-CoA dehydratase family protein [Desulfitobacteriaceae bacterium]|nr:2-hydroxyacyl-CoA dehydratase family protein [Desulfitobacteriaceae bacterium]MDI6915491.1 2-hydroxyacyl-CoA dehydratase family protein [Desulfitobacteriaceae bacterium]
MVEGKKYRQFRVNKHLKRLMAKHYALGRYQRYWGRPLHRKLAWITSGAPVELLRAFKIYSVYPEQYGAICSTAKATEKLCQAAEAAGYSQDLCSYARSHIGSILRPDLAPMQGLPKPDLLVACNNICGTVLKWYEALAHLLKVPLLVLDTPYLPGELTEHAHQYVLEQLQNMVGQLENLTGRKLDMQELKRQLARSAEMTKLWREIRELAQAHPSPLNGPDLFIQMAPIVAVRGSQEGIDYYRKLKAETEERVRRGEGAILEEKTRLVWDNIAIWPKLFNFTKMFTERGACFVTDTYSGGWAAELASGDPLESLAATYTKIFLNRSPEFRARQMIELVEAYEADGFVMHSNRSCKPYSLVQEVIRRRVMEKTGVPGLMVEADMADPRAYAEESVRTRVEAFLETLQAL